MIDLLDIPNSNHILNQKNIAQRVIFETQQSSKVLNSSHELTEEITKLANKFENDLLKNQDVFNNINKKVVSQAFSSCASMLLSLSPEKTGVEVTSNKTIYFFSRKTSYKMHLEVFFDHELSDANFECILNIFEGRTPILTNSGTLSEIEKEINSIFKKNKSSKKTSLYEISINDLTTV